MAKAKVSWMLAFSLIIIIGILISIPQAKAWVLPTDSYDQNKGTYTLSALAGLVKIAEVKYVDFTGNFIDYSFTRNFTFYYDVTPNEYSIDYYDTKGNTKENGLINSVNKIVTYEDVELDDWGQCLKTERVCTLDNKTADETCEDESIYEACVIGKRRERAEVLVDIDMGSTSFENGKSYLIRTYVKKKPSSNIDLIENFDGFVMDKWIWLNSTFLKKKPVYIKEMSGSSVVNYPVEINITYDSDMLSDFSDLMFANSSETGEVSYWINGTTATKATAYLNVSLTASTNHTFYMYYKNSTPVTSRSNMSKTFALADDFNRANKNGLDNLLTGQTWLYTGNTTGAQFSINNSRAMINTTAGKYAYVSYGDKATPFEINWIWNMEGTGIPLFTIRNSAGSNLFGITADFNINSRFEEYTDNLDLNVTTAIAANTNYSMKTVVYGNNNSYQLYINNQLKQTRGFTTTGTPNQIKFDEGSGTATTYYIDNFFNRSYVNPYPVIGFGDETSPGITTSLITPADNLNTTAASNTFNCSVDIDSGTGIILKNMTLYIWNSTTAYSRYYSNLSGTVTNSSTFSLTGMADGVYYWNCYAVGTLGTNYDWADSNRTLQVTKSRFGVCNTTYNLPVFNITIWDETYNNKSNSTIDSLSIKYWTTDSSDYTTFTYSNTANNNSNFTFCMYPNMTSTLNINYDVSYTGVNSPQRRLNMLTANLTNSSVTEKELYTLSTNEGIYTTFSVVSTGNAVIAGAAVTVEKQIDGLWTIIGYDVTDSAGTVTFWVNPNYDVRVTVVATGYSSQTLTLRPTQTIYTITMGGSSSALTTPTWTEGISYAISPASGLLPLGVYNFSCYIHSTKSDMQDCMFDLFYSNGTSYANDTGCSSTGGTLIIPDINFTQNTFGRVSVKINDSWYVIESDAHWANITIQANQNIGAGLMEAIKTAVDLPDWGESSQTRDFSRIVFFFLGLGIILAIMNFYTGYDTAYPGVSIYLVWSLIAIMTFVNGPTGQGYFYMEGLAKESGSIGGAILNNMIVFFFATIMMIANALSTLRRNQ